MDKLIIIAPWIFALITLLISFWATKSTSKNALLNINKSVLSENRQAWINNLRDSISDYITLHTLLDNPMSNTEKHLDLLREFTYIQTKIVLSLNPNEKDSKDLVAEIFKIAKPKEKRSEVDASEVKSKIMVLTQKILKKEWERVKAIE